VDYQVILNLMKEMNQTDLTKLEIEDNNGTRICMEKASPVAYAPALTMPVPMPQVNVTAPAAAAPVAAPAETVDKQPVELDGKKILSPMVGTFYSQASPEKPAFVKVGDKVKKGQTLCIIEAMKLMNEIESEYDGEVVQILIDNEEMVQFGQPLFVIR
jgi:acetyl-CoA carboxylase biotin carboxyl carrier protein